MHFKNNDDISLSLFELPKNLPYLYCEFNGHLGKHESNERYVLFVFWQNGKMHRIEGTAPNGEWDFKAYTPLAQHVIDSANQMNTRKARIIPKPEDRNVEGRILASDAGFFSKIAHTPDTPIYFRADISKYSDFESLMSFDIHNIESIIPPVWLKDLAPIKIGNFPLVKGQTYAHIAASITLIELIPQFQMFISKNVKNKNAVSSLRSMRGELHATIGSAKATWDGISIPAVLLRLSLKNNTSKQALFSFIYDLFEKKYELYESDNGFYSFNPLSLWLSKTNDFIETGIIDMRSIGKSEGSTLPEPPKEALMWFSFSPSHLAEAINNSVIQISPDLDFKETLSRLNKIENCTFTLSSTKSGTIRWKTFPQNR